ncbi:unnamed protein product, partial [Phaeothamnion confervicola]
WNHAFRSGPFDRGRLLDASLEALARDFEQFRAGWFSRLHEDLKPTPEERVARSQAYLDLLSSRIRPTVSFALKALGVIQKSGGLDAHALFAAVGPALAAREKGTVQAALKLLSVAVGKREDLRSAAWPLALEALLHEAPSVQADALAFLRKADSADVREAVAARAADLADSLRVELADWLGPARAEVPEVREEIELLEPWRSRVGLDEVRRAYEAGSEPTPLHIGPRRGRPVTPVADATELTALLSRLLEDPSDPLDIERALEGVARLGGVLPDARLTLPLLKRARKKFNGHFFFWGTLVEAMATLTLFWGALRVPPGPPLGLAWITGSTETTAQVTREFFGSRIEEVATRKAAVVLALPTHEPAWIDPRILAERVRAYPEPAELDFVAALLRLAPEGRDEALQILRGVPGEAAQALRYALG